MVKNIIFDLDGTLVDSSTDIRNCLKKAYIDCSMNVTAKAVKNLFIGPPLAEMIKLAMPDITKAEVVKIIREFRKHYDNSDYKRTILYDGVKNVLKLLAKAGVKMFIATNKPIVPAKRILSSLNIDVFHDVISPDKTSKKQRDKAQMISHLIDIWALPKENTIFVGDSGSDVLAARCNGISSVAVLYGYGGKEDIKNSRPDYIIEHISGLKKIVLNY